MNRLVFFVITFLGLSHCQLEQNYDLKDKLLSAGSELKAKVEEVLKQLKTNPKPNAGQWIVHLERQNANLASLLYLLKQAQSTNNIKQIEYRLQVLGQEIEKFLVEISKLSDATTHILIETTKKSAMSTETPITVVTLETKPIKPDTTVEPMSSTAESVDSCIEKQELLSNATELQERAKKSIKSLTDSHRIPEAMNLLANEKRLEQMIEELKIYFKEIDNIKTELSLIRPKIINQNITEYTTN